MLITAARGTAFPVLTSDAAGGGGERTTTHRARPRLVFHAAPSEHVDGFRHAKVRAAALPGVARSERPAEVGDAGALPPVAVGDAGAPSPDMSDCT